jgi:hypothetical protein
MRRKDMDTEVWYVVDLGYSERPGRVIDPGSPDRNKGKVLVVCDHRVYAGADRDEVGTKIARLADHTPDSLVQVALEFERTGRNTTWGRVPALDGLEAHWVTTTALSGRTFVDHARDVTDRIEAKRQEEVGRMEKERRERLAMAARWRAVAGLIDRVHPEPLHTIGGTRPQSDAIARVFEYDEHGRTSHIWTYDSDYLSRLAIYEAWAADLARLTAALDHPFHHAGGPPACPHCDQYRQSQTATRIVGRRPAPPQERLPV